MKYIVNHRIKNLLMNTIITSKRVAMTLFIAAALINAAVAQMLVTQSYAENTQSYTEFSPLFSSK